LEPKSVRILKFTLVAAILVLLVVALTAPDSWRYRAGRTTIKPMDLLVLAIPLAGLLLVYECVRSIFRSLGRRSEATVSDHLFLKRFVSGEYGYRINRSLLGSKIVYTERAADRCHELMLPAKDWGRGKLRYECLSVEEWKKLTPPWAWPRKDEIEYRIKKDWLCDCD